MCALIQTARAATLLCALTWCAQARADSGCTVSGAFTYMPSAPTTAPSPHDRLKNRYISFAPNNGALTVAFRAVTTANQFFPSCVGQQGWVQAPDANGISRLDVNPVYRVWPEPVIHVGDEEIVPVAIYEVYGNALGPVENPTPLVVPTIAQPTLNGKCWADVAGAYNGFEWTPPDGLANSSDLNAVLAFINNATTKPHFTVVDVEPQVPNKIVNVADVNRVIAAIAGAGYPFNLPPCSKVPCGVTVEIGVCCLPGGSCLDSQSPTNCSSQGGTFQGDDTTCGAVACGATGACCLPNFTCVEAGELDCAAQSGDYKGDFTDCGNYDCGCDVNNNSIPDSTEVSCAVCRTIPNAGLDVLASGGAFKIIYLDNTQQSLLGLTDAGTAFARSNPFNHGGPSEAGATVTNGGAAPYPNTAALAPEPCVIPPGFPEDPTFGPEIHIEMLSLDLSNGTDRVRAGQALFNSLSLAGRTDLYENTFGEAQGECIELPGQIYFNAFFEIETGGQKLYNKNPVVLRGEVNDLPIDLDDPGEDFINDPNFPATALFDANGVHQGYLVSVAFGSGGGGTLPPTSCESQPAFGAPISFTVDASSNGVLLTPPNHVNADAVLAEKDVTVYRSSGLDPDTPPDTSNVRYDAAAANLRGVVGPTLPLFHANDAINSLSFGMDGTVNLAVQGQIPVLLFSVDRTSTGVTCTDVRSEAERIPAEVAADVFIAPAINVSGQAQSFGAYGGAFVPPCSGGRGSCLVSDQTSLGLRPLFTGLGHDNVTSLEASPFLISDRAYLTFTGPSFNNDAATIYTHNGDTAFTPGNLALFATSSNMGLAGTDVIDALVVSDVTPGSDPQQPNGSLNAGQDEVLFSLAPGSPSLAAGGFSAADVFYSDFNGTFTRRYTAASQGLLSTDNVDALDISPGVGAADCNNNGILDQCDIDRGESVDADLNGMPDECETKNRYITFSPNVVYGGNAALDNVAFRVELVNNFHTPAATGIIGWVDAPHYQCDGGGNNNLPCTGPADCPGGSCTIITAKVSPTFVQRQWPETIVQVGDCEIFPVARYRITATTTPPAGPFVIPAFDVGTIVKPTGKSWGDVVGIVNPTTGAYTPPNGFTNVTDVQAVLFRIQSTPKPSFASANLEAISASDPCLNPQVNTADVLIVVKAAAGEPYPFSTDPFTNICPPCP